MKKIYHLPFTIYQSGFTLIELMVVLSITAVLGTLGVSGFTSYNQTQILQTSTNEIVTMLNLAKSRAQSQIKPSVLCPTGSLSGYKVEISIPRKYMLYLRCSIGGDIKINEQDKLLPTNLSFSANSSFFFPVQTGGVQTSTPQFDISNSNGKKKTITVNSLGGVSVQ